MEGGVLVSILSIDSVNVDAVRELMSLLSDVNEYSHIDGEILVDLVEDAISIGRELGEVKNNHFIICEDCMLRDFCKSDDPVERFFSCRSFVPS